MVEAPLRIELVNGIEETGMEQDPGDVMVPRLRVVPRLRGDYSRIKGCLYALTGTLRSRSYDIVEFLTVCNLFS